MRALSRSWISACALAASLASLLALGSIAISTPASAQTPPPVPQHLIDLRAAFLLSNAAEVAYRDPAEVDALLDKMGVKREAREVYDAVRMRLFMASIGPFTIIAFRGTESVDDWMQTNIRAVPVRTPEGEFHSGFHRAWKEVEPRVRAYLDGVAARNPGRRQTVWIGGHSLGGAVAVIAGIYLKRDEQPDQGYQIAGVVTFGQPRVVGAGVPVVVPKLIRYVFGKDPVPMLPNVGYADVGELRYDKRFDDILSVEDESMRRKLVDEYLGRLKQYIPTAGIGNLGGYVPSPADHAIKNYGKLLARHMVVDGDGCSKLISIWMIERDKPLPECATEEWLLGAGK